LRSCLNALFTSQIIILPELFKFSFSILCNKGTLVKSRKSFYREIRKIINKANPSHEKTGTFLCLQVSAIYPLYLHFILDATSRKNSRDQTNKLSGILTKGSTSLRAWSTSKRFIASTSKSISLSGVKSASLFQSPV
jgi:hypothetical protein